MGQSSLKRLIGPRVLACMLTLPLLTVFIAVLAILGAFGAEMLTGSITSLQYEMNTWSGLRMEDVAPSTLKTLFFGFLTGVSGCYFGMKEIGRASCRERV